MVPGILYAQTNITSPLLDSETFNLWYDTIHIPQMFSLPGSPNITYRYKAIDESRQTWQYLALYVLDDHTFTNIPIPEDVFTYQHPMFPRGKSLFDFVSFEGKDFVFVGDEGTSLGATEKAKWAVHAEVDVGDANSQQLEAVLNEERREGVRYSRYRLDRVPTAITHMEAADYDGPKGLAIFNIDQEKDVSRVVESLDRKLKETGAQVKFTTWEIVNIIKK